MNNKLFIPIHGISEARMDDMRVRLEGYHMFDRYGDARLAEKYKHFGFATVVPKIKDGKPMCFLRMLGCSYVFFPCGWQDDKCARKAFAWAEFLNKRIIFEEDGRCR